MCKINSGMDKHHNMSMRLAIIDDNILSAIGLQHLLEDIIQGADIVLCHDFEEMDSDMANSCAHYFVSSRIYFEHSQFFRNNPKKTIVLVQGIVNITGLRIVDVCKDEKSLVCDILSLHNTGHGKMSATHKSDVGLLSEREIQVAVLLCKGYINKEIADLLNISLTTVISHRKNIMAKLHAKSLADIIVHSVMNGYVNIGEL